LSTSAKWIPLAAAPWIDIGDQLRAQPVQRRGLRVRRRPRPWSVSGRSE